MDNDYYFNVTAVRQKFDRCINDRRITYYKQNNVDLTYRRCSRYNSTHVPYVCVYVSVQSITCIPVYICMYCIICLRTDYLPQWKRNASHGACQLFCCSFPEVRRNAYVKVACSSVRLLLHCGWRNSFFFARGMMCITPWKYTGPHIWESFTMVKWWKLHSVVSMVNI